MICVDLHVHTNASSDASTNPKLLVDRLYAHSIVKGVAITDHNTLDGYFQVRKLAAAYKDLLIIPGVEVTTLEGDLILLGVEEKPAYMSPLGTVVDFAKERAAVIVIPHPFRVGGISSSAGIIPADAVEILNQWATPQQNKLAEHLAKARNLPGVAGSDAHKLEELCAAYTEVDSEQDVDSVLKTIKMGRVRAVSARHI